jgi:hypothetical protein
MKSLVAFFDFTKHKGLPTPDVNQSLNYKEIDISTPVGMAKAIRLGARHFPFAFIESDAGDILLRLRGFPKSWQELNDVLSQLGYRELIKPE